MANDRILIIDDFLANEEAGAQVAGRVIRKLFQPGHQILIDRDYDVYSLARVNKLAEGVIEFVEE